jgi:PAS domain S-box-containing protein
MFQALRPSLRILLVVALTAGSACAPGADDRADDVPGAPAPLAAPDGAPAAPPDVRPVSQLLSEIWTEREGLPQNFIPVLAQTPDGYLWAGTERGLVRFDGLRFTVYTPESAPGLPSAWITALLPSADGTLWIGTGSGDLVAYRSGAFTLAAPGGTLGAATTIRALAAGPDGRLWVGTDGAGLLAVRIEGSEVAQVEPVPTGAGPTVNAIALDGDHAWIAGVLGVDRVEVAGSSSAASQDPWPPGAAERAGLTGEATALLVEPGGPLWVGTSVSGVVRIQNGERLAAGGEGHIPAAPVTALGRDRQGSIWVGTNGAGLHRVRGDTLESLVEGAGLPANLVRSLLEDREGNLWVGQTTAGLTRLQSGTFDWFGAPEGLSMNVALGLLEARNGDVWVGTPGGGVNRIRDGEARRFSVEEGLATGFVISVAEAPDGAIWVGMVGGGVASIRDTAVRNLGVEDGLLALQVSAVHFDGTGQFWVGYRGQGLQRLLPGPAQAWGVEDGLPSQGVTAILDDREGRVWAGTRGGVARVEPDGSLFTLGPGDGLPHAHVLGLYHDDDGSTWVATMGGLARVREDHVFAFGPEHGLPRIEPMSMVEDALGHLWISTSQGILRVARAELDAVAEGRADQAQVRHFTRGDGMRSAEANGGVHPASSLGRDGSIRFPTMAGVVRIDPASADHPAPVPPPVLESVTTETGVFPLDTPPEIPLGERSLEFAFAAPTFIAPEQVRVRYRLEGFDEAWRQASALRIARYTNLPPRDYRFVVEVAERDGRWTGNRAATDVRIAPRIHERRAVQVGGLLLILLLAGLGYRLRIRNLQRREVELLRLVHEREKASAALTRSEERLRLAMAAGRLGTWEWDLDADEVSWSDGVRRFFGDGPVPARVFGERLRERLPEPAAAATMGLLDQVRSGEREDFSIDFEVRTNGTDPMQVQLRGRSLGASSLEPRRVIGIASDVTELIRTQRELRQREEELRHAQKMEAVGSLAGGVAHDFNNLLAVIGMNARLALDSLDPGSPAHEEITATVRAADRAAELTQQLLAFSRKRIVQPQHVDLNASVEAVDRMLRRILRPNVDVVTDLMPELPAILADEGGIEQILVNLLVNAQDAMPRGGRITIRTRVAPGVAPVSGASGRGGPDLPRVLPERDPFLERDHVVLTVEDTGKGMDGDTMGRIFEPFFTTKGIGEGTGLGLASVYGVVQQAGGRVEVESTPGHGATFHVRFPMAIADPPG